LSACQQKLKMNPNFADKRPEKQKSRTDSTARQLFPTQLLKPNFQL
jgi:hypothetical protein